MKKLILATQLLLLSVAAYCQHGCKISLKNIASITFPDTPKTQKLEIDTLYLLSKDNLTYVAASQKIDKGLRDLANKHILDSVYADLVKGALEGAKAKLIYKKKINLKGVEGVEFSYKTDVMGQSKYTYSQAFYLNETILNYALASTDSLQRSDKIVTAFFNTFKFTLKDDEIRQSNGEDVAFKFGYLMGIVLFFGVLCSIGLGVVFLIRRLTR